MLFSRVSVEAALWTSGGGWRAGGRAGEGRFKAGASGAGSPRPRDRWMPPIGWSNCEKAKFCYQWVREVRHLPNAFPLSAPDRHG
jgi:hypothetical protein